MSWRTFQQLHFIAQRKYVCTQWTVFGLMDVYKDSLGDIVNVDLRFHF